MRFTQRLDCSKRTLGLSLLHHRGIELEILEVGTRGLKVRTTEAIPENTTLFLNLPIGDEFLLL